MDAFLSRWITPNTFRGQRATRSESGLLNCRHRSRAGRSIASKARSASTRTAPPVLRNSIPRLCRLCARAAEAGGVQVDIHRARCSTTLSLPAGDVSAVSESFASSNRCLLELGAPRRSSRPCRQPGPKAVEIEGGYPHQISGSPMGSSTGQVIRYAFPQFKCWAGHLSTVNLSRYPVRLSGVWERDTEHG